MKYSILLLCALTFFIITDTQAIDLFGFETKNFDYQTKSGMLHGDFLQKYPDGEKMAEGQFANNQRIGTWNFYNVNGKLIEKRLYFNNYEYAVMSKGEKTLKQFNTNGKWDLIKGKDVKFKQRLWKQVEKENGGYLEIDKLVKSINNSESTSFYSEERFINQIEKTQLNNITSIKIKEDYIYDNEREAMFSRTIGIGFVNGDNKTVAWIYYPDWKESFKNVITTWPNDHTNMKTLYDVFEQRAYNAMPYKQGKEKVTDKSMTDLELEMVHMENMFIIAKA